jgi:putative DNA primase/helicase
MLPLPTPVRGGSLEELRPFLNYAAEDDFRLMVAWLVMAIRPKGPYPVLALHGEQGSGKSTAEEVLRMLIDPNEALLRPTPRDERDLVIAGKNGRVVALENLSHISQWVSDALCRISTGSGFGTREIYTDDEETLFAVQLPIAINGIAEVIISGDLEDRSIILMLPVIEEYASEEEFWERFEEAQPKLLGALLDVICDAMLCEPSVELKELPRMADFARWMAASANALGWEADELLGAYARNRAAANETILAASPIIAPLRAIGNFEGTATDLLDRLVDQVGDGVARSKAWPKAPNMLTNSLRRLAPNLRRGYPAWGVAFERDAGQRIVVTGELEWVRERSSSPRSPSSDADDDGRDGDDGEIRTHSDPGVEEPLTVACPNPSHHPSWEDGRCSICDPEAPG